MLACEMNLQGIMINFRPHLAFPPISLSMRTKVTVISFTVGVTLLGFLAKILRRRKVKPRPPIRPNPLSRQRGKVSVASSTWSLTNGEIMPLRAVGSPSSFKHTRHGSISSDRQSVQSVLVPPVNLEATGTSAALTPQQLGTMGMEALETAIAYWEDALSAYRPPPGDLLALTDAEEGKFTHMLEKILDEAYKLQEHCSHLFLNESSVLFKEDSISVASSRFDKQSQSDRRTFTSMSSVESFVSAQAEIADLSDFEDFTELNIDLKELSFYQTALKKYEEGFIQIRLLRTEMVNCQTNMEFIAKVYCLRKAFEFLMVDSTTRKWFFDAGYKILARLMIFSEKDPAETLQAYKNLVEFSKDEDNWAKMAEELISRGVKDFTFYDIVIDFIILDAFEDLERPPSSVLAVIQNRWLSMGFKETALTTAIWSVFKSKRKMLKFSDGFIAHFYDVSEQLTPVLVWGFFGPNEKLKEICSSFKEEVLGFVLDIFNFKRVRYTRLEDLAQDVMATAIERFEVIRERMNLP